MILVYKGGYLEFFRFTETSKGFAGYKIYF